MYKSGMYFSEKMCVVIISDNIFIIYEKTFSQLARNVFLYN
ncbi:hypothetical protein PAEVO_31910 [Paenibacillus sp. GM2FR]|nr:hypothetical protein PAEVO_31910 [Paenibacillus sp. GM2FR]